MALSSRGLIEEGSGGLIRLPTFLAVFLDLGIALMDSHLSSLPPGRHSSIASDPIFSPF